MTEFFEFMFQSFWYWFGMVILFRLTFEGISDIIKQLKPRKVKDKLINKG